MSPAKIFQRLAINQIVLLINVFILFPSLVIQAQNKTEISLNGQWKLSYGLYDQNAPQTPAELKIRKWPEIPATVPGNVELDLLAAKEIKNPEIGNNVYDLRKYEAYQWWYSRSFETPKLNTGDHLELTFEGLDCLGTVWVNDSLVGKTDNMFIDYHFDVTRFLKSKGNNQICIQIDPVVGEVQKYFNAEIGARKYFRVEQVHIRKAPHMSSSWGYKKNDSGWKSSETLIRNLVKIAARGGNYLLNIGPKPDGTFPEESVQRLKEIGQWMKVNGEAIYGTQAGRLPVLSWGECTQKEVKDKTILYLSVFEWPKNGQLEVPGLGNAILSAKLLANGTKLKTTQSNGNSFIQVPDKAPDTIASVIRLEVKGKLSKGINAPKKKMQSGALD